MEQMKVRALPENWPARWIGGTKREAAWTEIALEVAVTIESGGAHILYGVQDESNYDGCELTTEGRASLYTVVDGQRQVWAEADVRGLGQTVGDGPAYVTAEPAARTATVWKAAVRIERSQTGLRLFIDDREACSVALTWSGTQPRTAKAGEADSGETCDPVKAGMAAGLADAGSVEGPYPSAALLRPGTIALRTEVGQRAVFRELRVFDPMGRALCVHRFYDPSCIGFTAGEIDRSGNGLRLGPDSFARCETPVAVDHPLLRRAFDVSEAVVRATVRVYALGWYELQVNGRKLDDRVLAPANTPYDKRMLYDEYDATTAIRQGANALGLSLGNGYNINYSRWGWKWKRDKAVAAVLELELSSGRKLTIGTDESWRTTDGPLLMNDIYDGETCDGRLAKALEGWASATYDESEGDWRPVELAEAPEGVLLPNPQPPLRPQDALKPVQTLHPRPGVAVYDFGQNISGWVRIQVTGASGAQITLRYSELIDESGAIDPWTNRNARATDRYILHGGGEERYEPSFTYHGFRYVEVTGEVVLEAIEAVPVRADVRESGSFRCGEPLLEQIQSNLRWSVLNNLASIPTDCCQRDERTPCMMDSAVVEEAAMFNFDMRDYYVKWLGDIRYDMTNPDWAGDKVTLPWYLYQHYGDEATLAESYSAMREYVDHLAAKYPDAIVTEGFGDWCPPNEDGWEHYFREVSLVNTALYAQQATVVASAAQVLGLQDDQAQYEALATRVREAFHARFYVGDGVYGSGTQTSQVLPLALGLVSEDYVEAAVAHLVRAIAAADGHLDTGIYATRYLVDVLADHGQIDLAYRLLTRTTYPSFGWQIAQGATTLWEQWSFKGGMHSHDHAMFAGVGASFYTRLAGIRALEPGFDRIAIRPFAPSELGWAQGELTTRHGRIASSWRREGERLILEVEVPPGTSADIALPLPGGELLELAREVGPGRHRFEAACSI